MPPPPDGWRFAWLDLPDDIKRYDRDAVCAFPEILAKAGLKVRRR